MLAFGNDGLDDSQSQSQQASSVSSSRRELSIDDALAIKGVGALNANRQRAILAIEAEGGILVLDSKDGRVIKRLAGQGPQWSPDGARLAFFSRQSGHDQLHVWQVDDDRQVQITQLPLGVLPNIRTMGATCDAHRIAWSPDSVSVAFTSMLVTQRGIPDSEAETPGVRVFRSTSQAPRSSIEAIYRNRAATKGVFTEQDHWRAQFPNDSVSSAALENAARTPESVANRIVIVDIDSQQVRFVPGQHTQYFCPAWSPDGSTLASVADVTETSVSNEQYGALGVPVRSTAALFDLRTARWRLLPQTAFERVRSVMWTGQSDGLIAIVESGPKLLGFPRLAAISAVDGSASLIDVPHGQAVKDIRAARDGNFAVRLAGRFVDTLWFYSPQEASFDQVSTHDWHVTGFDTPDGEGMMFWAESAAFKGRLIQSEPGRAPRILYDANPQTIDLPLGEQRRFTWKNRHGEEVDGILIFPPGHDPAQRYPVVVDAYPRPATDNFRLGSFIEDTGHLLAAQGFVIFRPAIRSPHGGYWFTRDEAYTGKAVGAPGVALMRDDFESGIEALVEEGIADPDRIGLYGHSNGGWLANFLVTESAIPAAAVIQSGVSNAVMMALWPNVKVTRGMDAATGGNVFDDFDDYVRLSPIFRMRDVRIPMLLMVGDHDHLWVPQMISQYGVLRAEGRDATLVRYPDEGHTLSKRENVLDALQRMTAFFHEHLRPSVTHPPES